MKRRRRLFTSFQLKCLAERAYGGEVVPPGSIVIANEDFRERYGAAPLRVAYYSRVLGLNAVILLDENGKQQADISQKELSLEFRIVELSKEDDHYQNRTPPAERYWASARGE